MFMSIDSTFVKISGETVKVEPTDSIFVKNLVVGTVATQLDDDTRVREEITILADDNNTDTIYIGDISSQLFPLVPGAALTIRKCSLSNIYARANTGTQTLHIIAGGW